MNINDILDGIKIGEGFEIIDKHHKNWNDISINELLIYIGKNPKENNQYDNIRIKVKWDEIVSENLAAIFNIIDTEFGISSPVQNKIKHHLTVLVHGYSIRLNEMEDKK